MRRKRRKLRKNRCSKHSASTVRHLKMYNTKSKHNHRGGILKAELQSKQVPNTCIRGDPRWFGISGVINQKQLQNYREEPQRQMGNSYNVILNQRVLPASI
ncbi:hypothetical protein P3X46_027029 [Hevea brasiliensis]|uniref:Nucleolar GTP-binding protein 2 N-terminal domain-containing protein n=1 Tax=Hevea brasiliensis TaxID=3981 RepID=A0ABQ9KYG7_HEVBR|nr:hypothetical protein P3X46_027029 [Hevea brasiliensis]